MKRYAALQDESRARLEIDKAEVLDSCCANVLKMRAHDDASIIDNGQSLPWLIGEILDLQR